MHLPLFSFVVASLIVFGSGCSQQPAGPASAVAAGDKAAVKDMDEPAIRAAISLAIREQRLYSPAGNNAIEWYLSLRERLPEDAEIGVALMELEPYAVIAAEQSLARQEFDEARRLTALIERANEQASALPRLREQLAQKMAKAESERESALAVLQAVATIPANVLPAAGRIEGPTPAVTAPAPSIAAVATKPAASAEPARVSPAAAAPTTSVTPPSSVSTTSLPARMPSLLRDRSPRYPAIALRRKIEGSVELAFTIKGDGSVTDVRVVNATPPGIFDEAAIATTKHWQFEALGRDMATRRSINFTLPKQVP